MTTVAIILAAGKGTRFGQSKINKTAVKVGDKSLIQIGIEKIEDQVDSIVVVVGYKKGTVINSINSDKVVFVNQTKQLGTGHAVKIALKKIGNFKTLPDNVLVANGDHLFMIDPKVVKNLLKTHVNKDNDVTILTSINKKPGNLDNGRIVRKDGKIVSIVEKSDFTSITKSINELNTGTYVFKYSPIESILSRSKVVKGSELYITGLLFKLHSIGSYIAPFEKVGTGVNTKEELKGFDNQESKTKIFKSYRHRLVELFVVIAILLVLLGKLLLRDQDAFVFLAFYGITVSLVMWITFIVSFIFYKDPYHLAIQREKEHSKNKNYLVSCMVAVKNEQENIARCIDSILDQTYRNIEVIVVNDASTDGTLNILKKYKRDKKIHLINLKINVGKKRALGEAMAVAKGEIFAHTDSDSTWAPGAIEKIVKIFEYFDDVGAVSGHGRARNGDKNLLTKMQDAWMEGQFSVRKAFESVFGSVTCVSGPLAAFRKQAVFNYIPAWVNDKFLGQEFKFATDRTITGFVLGSKAIGEKMKRKYKNSPFIEGNNYPTREWRVVYCKSAKSWTLVPDTFGRLVKQQIRWKKSFIRNIFFTGLFFWKKPLPVALVYYLHIIFVLMGPFIAFRHLIYLPIKGNIISAILYLSGIIFVGFMFGLACKLEDKENHGWVYRPIMSLFSTFVISWLLFYSAFTIRKMVWTRN